MITIEEATLAYGAAWNEPNEDRCCQLLDHCWADTGVVIAPDGLLAGRDAVFAAIRVFQVEHPGWRAELTSGLDVHHSVVRFSFAVVQPDGRCISEGLDVGEAGPDGRLTRIITFYGPLPEVSDV